MIQVTPVIRSFCRVRSVVPSPFGWITSYVAYIQHMRGWCVTHHFRDERSKVKVTRVVRIFYRVRSVAPSPFHRFISYEIHTQPMWPQCVAYHFHVKRSKVKVTRVIWICCHACSVASSLLDRITLYVAYTQHTRGDVSRVIFRMKGQRSRSHGLFKVNGSLGAMW